VGKSSLLNALAGDDIAIVTPIAGTTRDKVVQQIHINGIPIHIVDTAGLRDTTDEVESIGIARTWAAIEKANVIVHLQDVRHPGHELDHAITKRLPAHTPVLNVFNKLDLLQQATERGEHQDGQTAHTSHDRGEPTSFISPDDTKRRSLFISAKTGEGLDELRQVLLDIAGWNPGTESPWLARQRHLDALNSAAHHLTLAAGHAAQSDQVLDLFAEELRLAHDALGAITGQFITEDLLCEIFFSFCIGK